MLEHDGVAEGEVRGGEPGDLVGGEVPRHDAEEHADRAAADDRAAGTGGDVHGLVGEVLLGVVGVVVVDVHTEVDLTLRLVARLAHLPHDAVRQLVTVLGVQIAEATQQRGAVGHGAGAPPRGGLVRGVDGRGHLGVGGGGVGLDELAGGRVGDCVHRISRRVRGGREPGPVVRTRSWVGTRSSHAARPTGENPTAPRRCAPQRATPGHPPRPPQRSPTGTTDHGPVICRPRAHRPRAHRPSPRPPAGPHPSRTAGGPHETPTAPDLRAAPPAEVRRVQPRQARRPAREGRRRVGSARDSQAPYTPPGVRLRGRRGAAGVDGAAGAQGI